MREGEVPPEADRAGGAPHPRETACLIGQGEAEAAFLAAEAAGRLHHAWLLAGPRGVGKATLAWRIARRVIAGASGPSLDMDPAHPVFARLRALSEPRLLLLRRGWDEKAERLRAVIDVEELRRLRGFLGLSAADGGWRAVILDAAEEMNASAANALLKLLEEPPPRTLFLLVSHQPARLAATIRSRCRELRLRPLAPPDLARALAAAGRPVEDPVLLGLAGGSAGEALLLAAGGGAALWSELVGLLATLPRLDRVRLVALAESLQGREAAGRHETLHRLLARALARLARHGAAGELPEAATEAEAALLARLAPDARAAASWAEAAARVGARGARARALNLDPAQAMLDTFLDIEATALRLSAAA